MKIQDIAGHNIKVSRSTITALNNNDKVAGMITNVSTFYNVPPREQSELFVRCHKLNINRYFMPWDRLFFIESIWYYLADDHALAKAHKYRKFYENDPVAKLEEALLAAKQFGAEIIHVARVTDTRK